MSPSSPQAGLDVGALVQAIDSDLRDRGTAARADHEKAYLKSDLDHYGTAVPAIRSVTRAAARRHRLVRHDDLVATAEALWEVPVHERRVAVVELLDARRDLLGPDDLPLVERLLRESRTWALVDGLAIKVMGSLVERHPEAESLLDRWVSDEDLWLRRTALLALLLPLRRGEGDFSRFSRYADGLLDDREFFVGKAIGWVLRDTAKKRPELVSEWLLPRAARASAVTIREAIKPLSEQQRAAVRAARGS